MLQIHLNKSYGKDLHNLTHLSDNSLSCIHYDPSTTHILLCNQTTHPSLLMGEPLILRPSKSSAHKLCSSMPRSRNHFCYNCRYLDNLHLGISHSIFRTPENFQCMLSLGFTHLAFTLIDRCIFWAQLIPVWCKIWLRHSWHLFRSKLIQFSCFAFVATCRYYGFKIQDIFNISWSSKTDEFIQITKSPSRLWIMISRSSPYSILPFCSRNFKCVDKRGVIPNLYSFYQLLVIKIDARAFICFLYAANWFKQKLLLCLRKNKSNLKFS